MHVEMSSFTNKSSDPRLQRYSAVRQVGKGSYGEVFLVRHSKEKKQVCCYCTSWLGSRLTAISLLQYVMKNIKLTASSAKERLAAEQEVCVPPVRTLLLYYCRRVLILANFSDFVFIG